MGKGNGWAPSELWDPHSVISLISLMMSFSLKSVSFERVSTQLLHGRGLQANLTPWKPRKQVQSSQCPCALTSFTWCWVCINECTWLKFWLKLPGPETSLLKSHRPINSHASSWLRVEWRSTALNLQFTCSDNNSKLVCTQSKEGVSSGVLGAAQWRYKTNQTVRNGT